MDNETKENIGRALYGKIVKNSMTAGNLQEFSAAKYLSEYDKYKPVLEKVMSKENLGNLDDIAVAARRANLKTINLIDPSNPSGTGIKSVIGSLIGGGIIGTSAGGLSGLVTAVVSAGSLAGAARLAAKGVTRVPLTKLERTLLLTAQAGAGAGIGAATAPEGEGMERALIGAGAGLLGPSVLKKGYRAIR